MWVCGICFVDLTVPNCLILLSYVVLLNRGKICIKETLDIFLFCKIETLNYFTVKLISYACMYIKFLLTKLRDRVIWYFIFVYYVNFCISNISNYNTKNCSIRK